MLDTRKQFQLIYDEWEEQDMHVNREHIEKRWGGGMSKFESVYDTWACIFQGSTHIFIIRIISISVPDFVVEKDLSSDAWERQGMLVSDMKNMSKICKLLNHAGSSAVHFQ